jgi:carboxyl-terminal processing protease
VLDRRGKQLRFKLRLAEINVPSTYVREVSDHVGLIEVNDFMLKSTVEEMNKAMQQLSNAHAFVLDLRHNPGGSISVAMKVASIFLKRGTVCKLVYSFDSATVALSDNEFTPTNSHGKTRTEPRERYLLHDRPVVILVDGRTASAAELLTGAFQDQEFDDKGKRIFTVLGTPTFGKGVGQTTTADMRERTVLNVTSFKYVTPKGRWPGDGQENRYPLIPDVIVSVPAIFEAYSPDDAAFKAAMEILKASTSKDKVTAKPIH